MNAVTGWGWGCLGYNPTLTPRSLRSTVVTPPSSNQDPFLSDVPIDIDIWEHVFYLRYHNVKADVSPSRAFVFRVCFCAPVGSGGTGC